MSIQIKKNRNITLIFGRTGSGKSFHAKKLIKNYNRVVIVDALYEYENGIIFNSFDDFINYNIEFLPPRFTFICRFQTDEEIEFLFKTCYQIGNLLLVLEEAEIYISPYSKSSEFLNLVRYGRHRSISILGIARRTAELSIDLRAMVNKIISFKQTEIYDLKKMESLGFFELDKLNQYEYIEKEY
jgi:ABC-type dipeptide/oligopeptide/nickel transport system ATPase component